MSRNGAQRLFTKLQYNQSNRTISIISTKFLNWPFFCLFIKNWLHFGKSFSQTDCMNFLSSLFRGTRSLKMRAVPNVGSLCEEHHVNQNSIFEFPDNTKSIMFGMGCFWGAERLFWKQSGVYSTQGNTSPKNEGLYFYTKFFNK